MNNQLVFTGNDLRLIEALEYQPNLKPRFDQMRDCLVWADEEPNGLTPDAYDNLCRLWVARSFLHRNLDFSAHPLDPEFIRQFWERANEQGFKWPGFKRLALGESDKVFYEHMLEESRQGKLL